jgi:hypothetical protein
VANRFGAVPCCLGDQRTRAYRLVVMTVLLALPDLDSAFAASTDGQPTESSDELPYWSRGEARPFASGRAIAGLGYARLAGNFGYGKPHWTWAGVEFGGFVSPFYATIDAGVHASLVVAELSVAMRRTFSFAHVSVPSAESISSSALGADGPKARTTTVDIYLWGILPWRRYLLAWETVFERPLGEPDDTLWFEEYQRVMMSNQGLGAVKLTPTVRLGTSLYLGPMAEFLFLFGRPDSSVLRLGPSVYWSVSDHFEFITYATLPVLTPDRLSLFDRTYAAIGLRYRFATGEGKRRQP